MAPKVLAVGDVVESRHKGGPAYYPGKVSAVNEDGTYAIAYDGEWFEGVDAVRCRRHAAAMPPPPPRLTRRTHNITPRLLTPTVTHAHPRSPTSQMVTPKPA